MCGAVGADGIKNETRPGWKRVSFHNKSLLHKNTHQSGCHLRICCLMKIEHSALGQEPVKLSATIGEEQLILEKELTLSDGTFKMQLVNRPYIEVFQWPKQVGRFLTNEGLIMEVKKSLFVLRTERLQPVFGVENSTSITRFTENRVVLVCRHYCGREYE